MSLDKKDEPGNDAMPNIVVKIVGSKYVRYVVNKPNTSRGEDEAIDIPRQVSEEFSALRDSESLEQRFQEVDRSLSGLVSRKEFQISCESRGVTVSSRLLRAILSDSNYSQGGQIRWKMFMALLKETKMSTNPLPCAGEQEEDRSVSVKDSYNQQHVPEATGKPSFHCASVADRRCPQNARPVSQPAMHFSEDKYSGEQENWIDRFMKLENVLRLCMNKNSGMVEMERAKSLIYNYNHIYHLSLSEDKIEDALWSFHAGQNILVEPLLLYLKEL
uniref:EF-hand domain-containing protein n=1 Tax=Leptobrachium leishanense TaxID=445787 RepID=A0A8C5R548_9ANUR